MELIREYIQFDTLIIHRYGSKCKTIETWISGQNGHQIWYLF